MYIENPELGYAHSGTVLYSMLGASYLGDGNDYTTGNVQSLSGVAGTFTTGMGLGYMYQQAPDNYVDYIGSVGGTLIFRSQDGNGRGIYYGGPSNSYRSIYVTCNFGALRNTTTTKQQLLTKYIEYLLPTTVAEDQSLTAIQDLAVGPNPSPGRTVITFMLNRPAGATVSIYDAAGQKVRDLSFPDLRSGAQRLTWDGRNDRGQTVSSGTYVVRIHAGDADVNRTVVLVK